MVVMYVWRIETEDGVGAYRVDRWLVDQDEWPSFMRLEYNRPRGKRDPHPAPREDGLGYGMVEEEFCGFKSAKALMRWFYRAQLDGRRLEAMGLRVTVWRVKRKHVRLGHRQLVFRRRKAKRIAVMSPVEFEGTLA